jgi:hypothetical protein
MNSNMTLSTILRVKLPWADIALKVVGSGQPVILLHGGGPGTSSLDWNTCMNHLADGIQCFAPDLPGFGKSGKLKDGFNDGLGIYVDTIIALMDLFCIDSCVLVGHSMGAAVAAALAVQYPDRIRHLIVVAPGGGFYGIDDYTSAGMAAISEVIEQPTEAKIQSLVELLCHQTEIQPEQVRRRINLLTNSELLEVQRKIHFNHSNRSDAEKLRRASFAPLIKVFKSRVTLIWGDRERFNPVELGERILAKLPKHAIYALIKSAGHNVHCDKPAEVAKIISDAAL